MTFHILGMLFTLLFVMWIVLDNPEEFQEYDIKIVALGTILIALFWPIFWIAAAIYMVKE